MLETEVYNECSTQALIYGVVSEKVEFDSYIYVFILFLTVNVLRFLTSLASLFFRESQTTFNIIYSVFYLVDLNALVLAFIIY